MSAPDVPPAGPELLAFMIELSIGDAPALFLVLAADGTVNRGGSGKEYPVEKDVFVQRTDGRFFREVRELFDPSWLGEAGVHTLKGEAGPRHRLKLSLLCRDRPPVAVEFDYRVDSGPPPAIQAFVQRAVEATQPWYDEQREAAARFDAGATKPAWWKLW